MAAQHRDLLALFAGVSQIGQRCPLNAVTMRDPSRLKAADFTSSHGRARTAILAVAASQMRAVLSLTP